MLPSFDIVEKLRPVDLISSDLAAIDQAGPGPSGDWATPAPAPYWTAMTELAPDAPPAARQEVRIGSGQGRLIGWCEGGRVGLDVVDHTGRATSHVSRRHGRIRHPPGALAVALTGTHATVFTHIDGWVARARADLTDRLDTRDPAVLAELRSGHAGPAVKRFAAGPFGQLGLRDPRFVTDLAGRPVTQGRRVLLTLTHAGPGFFDTAHCGVWSLDVDTLELRHRADLFFGRPDRPGVYGDHATHLVRTDTGWMAAASTWGDFGPDQPGASVSATLAESTEDLTRGQHVLATRLLPLPTTGLPSVGVWDPHLVHTGEEWLVGYVNATRFFAFHPMLARGPALDRLTVCGSDPRRRATEGTTLARIDDRWLVLASDGRDGRGGQRAQYPVFDETLTQLGLLDAPYPTNLPWPTLGQVAGEWLMVTFDGTRRGGSLLDYGTHGSLVIMRERGRA